MDTSFRLTAIQNGKPLPGEGGLDRCLPALSMTYYWAKTSSSVHASIANIPARGKILGPTTAMLLSTKPKPREAEIFHHHLRCCQCIALKNHKGKPEWLALPTLVRFSI